ncbi:MAG TPA: DNA-processing protein DprA [Thermomicrobiales bacterium]|nr:DNA-processing protein DprA [Thermomicrobiales bacterium]
MSQGSIIPPTAKYWIGFQQTKRIGPVRLQRLLEHFTTIDAAWHAPVADLRSVLDETSLDRFVAVRREFDGDAEIERIDRLGISISTLDSATYPALLREIPNPPSVLYYKGTLVAEDARSVGIVGSRNCTPYGRQMAQTISRDLAAAEITVISGLALGIDGQAHRGALEGGGRTIAVLGSGVDQIYPGSHRELAERIAESGAIVSDYPPGTKPDARNFPPRNRIIAGMTRGTVVIEAPIRSGALITVEFALDYGRDVMCVPGHANSDASAGTLRAIRDGARMVTSARDILEDLGMATVMTGESMQQSFPMTDDERHLYKYVRWEPMHIDEIAVSAGIPAHICSGLLVLLELKGAVRDAGGQHFVRATT